MAAKAAREKTSWVTTLFIQKFTGAPWGCNYQLEHSGKLFLACLKINKVNDHPFIRSVLIPYKWLFFFPIKIVDWRPLAVYQLKITFLLSQGLAAAKNHTRRLVRNKKRLLKLQFQGEKKKPQARNPDCTSESPKASRFFVLLRIINLNLSSGSLDWLS